MIVEKRISSICSTADIHRREKEAFENKLRRDGHGNVKLKFTPQPTNQEKLSKHVEKMERLKSARKIIWFNPVFSRRVKPERSVGKAFFEAMESSFPVGSNLRKLINKNKIKMSYRNMPNFEMVINSINRVTLEEYLFSDSCKPTTI